MIQVNTTTHTKGGVTISTGSVLNVRPHFLPERIVEGLTKYDISFDVTIYKNMNEYLAQRTLVRDYMQEYAIDFVVRDVDVQALTSVSSLLALLQSHIENGGSFNGVDYSGVGVGNTTIVYPPTV